jgi:type IV pilus assembly protein PilV
MRCRGFTLVETLVALVVLSVGMLGAATLLLSSLRDQGRSQHTIAAGNLLQDVADRIRVNRQGRAAYATAAVAPDCRARACDAAQLAAADRAYLMSAARALLPESTAMIAFAPATSPDALDRYTLTLRPSRAREDDTEAVSLQLLLRAPVDG